MEEVLNKYRIWSEAFCCEGPLEFSGLVKAIKANRVHSATWIFLDHEQRWARAGDLPEVSVLFRPAGADSTPPARAGAAPIKPGALRRIRLFAEMNEHQLQAFVQIMELAEFPQFATVVRAGEQGDSMFLVLQGELRARQMISGKETTLATMGVGEFFGEVALLDHGPRSADVIANQPSLLLKIGAEPIGRLLREQPATVAPFFFALSRYLVGRFRGLNKKYEDTIRFARLANAAP